MIFSSDNWAPATAPVMAALAAAGDGAMPAYGADPITLRVTERLSEIFARKVDVFFVATGTAANALALTAAMRPAGVVLCHETSHAVSDEAGAPEFYTGGRLAGLPGRGGKLTVATLEPAVRHFSLGGVHYGRPVAISLTQSTEWGTVYQPEDVAAIGAFARAHGLRLHMDGARFANALVHLGCTAADMTWKAGVDLLSFGGTKNGCWCAEAVISFDPALSEDIAYARKRAGQLLSKSRFVAAQFDGYLAHDHWLDNARHANAMAARLGAGLRAAGHRLAAPVEANEVFPLLPSDLSRRLAEAGARFYDWPANGLAEADRPGAGEEILRLVTSFRTTVDEVDRFLGLVSG